MSRRGTSSSSGSAPLERSYRHLLRLFPPGWRRHREEEVLGVLLAAAPPGRAAATRSERLDLAAAAGGAWGRTTLRAVRAAPGSAVGVVVLVLGMLVVALPAGAARQSQAGSPPPLPARLPGYSALTESVSASPPGRAVALYQHGLGVELGDTPQAVVVGAGGAVRRLDLAEGRGEGAQGDPGPMLLSPDGTRVAVGRYDVAHPDLAVQDLRTGEVVRSPALPGRAVLPLAWAPDGRTVLVAGRASAWGTRAGAQAQAAQEPDSLPLLVDTSSGAVTRLAEALPGAPGVVHAAAYSPDGTRLALQTDDAVVVADLTGRPDVVDVVDVTALRPTALGGAASLVGPDAWSPDGTLLATDAPCAYRGADVIPPRGDGIGVPATGVAFLAVPASVGGPVAGSVAGPVPACLPAGAGYSSAVGWTGLRSVALQVGSEPDGTTPPQQQLVSVDLATGAWTVLATVPDDVMSFAVSRMQVPRASLVGAAEARAGGADEAQPRWQHGLRGSPVLQLLGVVSAAGVAGIVAVAAAGRRPRRVS